MSRDLTLLVCLLGAAIAPGCTVHDAGFSDPVARRLAISLTTKLTLTPNTRAASRQECPRST